MSINIHFYQQEANTPKTAVIDTEWKLRKNDAAALQGTRLADSGTIKENHYTFFEFTKPAGQPRFCGTGFNVRNNFLNSKVTPAAVSNRLSMLYVNTRQSLIRVISAYTPNISCRLSRQEYLLSAAREEIIIAEYRNARIGNARIGKNTQENVMVSPMVKVVASTRFCDC